MDSFLKIILILNLLVGKESIAFFMKRTMLTEHFLLGPRGMAGSGHIEVKYIVIIEQGALRTIYIKCYCNKG